MQMNLLWLIETFCSLLIISGTGPLTYHDNGDGADFVKAIQALSANGGGDCPELTIRAMINALEESPRWGSPMYVFTDATAKDDTADNLDELEYLAKDFGVTINFFTTGEYETTYYFDLLQTF